MSYQKGPGQTVVIALGGNALGNTPQEQLELVKNTASHIVDMVSEGVNVVVSHGNGPQVGMIQNAFDYANAHDGKTPAMPLPECGAMSQGYIGYQLSQAILNELKRRDIMRSSVALITQTVVDANDPAFQDPTKPVGAFLTEDEAVRLANETGATFKEDAGRGWRQVVASPAPVRIVEFDAIKDLVDDGYLVVSSLSLVAVSVVTTLPRSRRERGIIPVAFREGAGLYGISAPCWTQRNKNPRRANPGFRRRPSRI